MKFDFDMDLNFGLWHPHDWVPGRYLEWALPGPPGYAFDSCVVIKLRTYDMLWNWILDLDLDFGSDYESLFVTSMRLWLTLSLCVLHEYGEEKIFCTCESLHLCALMCARIVVMGRLLVWLSMLCFLLDSSEDWEPMGQSWALCRVHGLW